MLLLRLPSMLIAGTIICGGGPVVIPLLRGYTVDPGWVNSRDFLLGFAILQAFPGPNLEFSAYLGFLAVPSNRVLGAVLGYLGIFTPGILLKLALLPLYKTWRNYSIAKSALRGLNAAAVGLIFTAVWQLFLGECSPAPLQLGHEADQSRHTFRSRSHLYFRRGHNAVNSKRSAHD